MSISIYRTLRLYAEEIWWLMEHSEDPKRRALTVTCYCDDSGTHEKSKFAVIGGPLMNRPMFIKFADRWEVILRKYRIAPPFHTKEFVRPYGKYCAIPDEMKFSLFRDITRAINQHKIYSLSVAISQEDFKQLVVSMEVYRKFLAPYALAYLLAAILNHCCAERQKYNDPIAYLVDQGSPYAGQLREAHAVIREWEKSGKTLHTGSMDFADDTYDAALQAADVVAWTARKVLDVDGTLPPGFAPLGALLSDCTLQSGRKIPHFPVLVTKEFLAILGEGLNGWLSTNAGALPINLSTMGPNMMVRPSKNKTGVDKKDFGK